MFRESRGRAITKTISWRILATLTTSLIVYIFVGRLDIAATIGGLEAVVKMALFFIHERAWDRISFGRKPRESCVLWFTGLSGSGKSTLAEKTAKYMRKKGFNVEQLDGDVIRSMFPKTGFSIEERQEHLKRVGNMTSMLEKRGVSVVSSFISPFAQSREEIRHSCQNFIEIFVDAPLEECERRDVKGLYAKARRGEISNFTGIDSPFESPASPEIHIRTDRESVDQSFEKIKSYINTNL